MQPLDPALHIGDQRSYPLLRKRIKPLPQESAVV